MLISDAILALLKRRALSSISMIVLHHSFALRTLDITRIAEMEKTSIGATTVAYNSYCKLVDADQDLWVMQQGRPIDCWPAAQYGGNDIGYAICLAGNYHPPAGPTDPISEHALKLIAGQILAVKAKAPNLRYLVPHRGIARIAQVRNGWTDEQAAELAGTACPGDLLVARLAELRTMTGLIEHPLLKAA